MYVSWQTKKKHTEGDTKIIAITYFCDTIFVEPFRYSSKCISLTQKIGV